MIEWSSTYDSVYSATEWTINSPSKKCSQIRKKNEDTMFCLYINLHPSMWTLSPLSEQDRFIPAIAPWYEHTGITDMPMSAVDSVDTSFEPF